MAYTQAHIDALKEAIATGALEVEFGTGTERRRIKYRSIQEMRSILAEMIAEASPNGEQPMRTVGQFNNGLWPFCDR